MSIIPSVTGNQAAAVNSPATGMTVQGVAILPGGDATNPLNVNSYHPVEVNLSADHLPEVLGRLDPPDDWEARARGEVPALIENGQIAVDAAGNVIKDFPFLPRYLSSNVKPRIWYLEYCFRMDPRLSYIDLWARMPGGTPKLKVNHLGNERERFRKQHKLYCWLKRRGGVVKAEVAIAYHLTPMNCLYNTAWDVVLGVGIRQPGTQHMLPLHTYLRGPGLLHTPSTRILKALAELERLQNIADDPEKYWMVPKQHLRLGWLNRKATATGEGLTDEEADGDSIDTKLQCILTQMRGSFGSISASAQPLLATTSNNLAPAAPIASAPAITPSPSRKDTTTKANTKTTTEKRKTNDPAEERFGEDETKLDGVQNKRVKVYHHEKGDIRPKLEELEATMPGPFDFRNPNGGFAIYERFNDEGYGSRRQSKPYDRAGSEQSQALIAMMGPQKQGPFGLNKSPGLSMTAYSHQPQSVVTPGEYQSQQPQKMTQEEIDNSRLKYSDPTMLSYGPEALHPGSQTSGQDVSILGGSIEVRKRSEDKTNEAQSPASRLRAKHDWRWLLGTRARPPEMSARAGARPFSNELEVGLGGSGTANRPFDSLPAGRMQETLPAPTTNNICHVEPPLHMNEVEPPKRNEQLIRNYSSSDAFLAQQLEAARIEAAEKAAKAKTAAAKRNQQ
ncbi:MAG: hypothetical protein M1830_009647 [Pleopsidium flavum]|nr:MAG: hypothetical protein M1830_009647 [Pleopsidium flavum]